MLSTIAKSAILSGCQIPGEPYRFHNQPYALFVCGQEYGASISHLEDEFQSACITLWTAQNFSQPVSVIGVNSDYATFKFLLSQWHEERGTTSSIDVMISCPSYQRIIGMGDSALPLIFQQMREEGDDPDHWSWALQMITGADPVPESELGNTEKMAKRWFNWEARNNAW